MNPNPTDLADEIMIAEKALDGLGSRERRLWEHVRIQPTQWRQEQYAGAGSVWVIAVMGNRCLYFNTIEEGWGWGRFETWGNVTEYHWQQDEIQHSIYQSLFAVDHGGQG